MKFRQWLPLGVLSVILVVQIIALVQRPTMPADSKSASNQRSPREEDSVERVKPSTKSVELTSTKKSDSDGDKKVIVQANPEASGKPEKSVDSWVTTDDDVLTQLYTKKLANPSYVAWKSQPGLPTGYQDFEEEHLIKTARSSIAAKMELPSGIEAIRIPVVVYNIPDIDGKMSTSEWISAAKVPIGIRNEKTLLYLLSDGKNLYVACDVPGETTVSGFDQFRFYYHVKGSAVIVNERVHVSGRGNKVLGGIRQTTVRWQGAAPANDDERWKKYPISEWRIYKHAQGASSFAAHRRYEAMLDLDEVGLHMNVPFAGFVEVETDPERQNGKFVQRRYLGLLGTQASPVWFLIDRSLAFGGTQKARSSGRSEDALATTPRIHKWVDEEGRVHFSDKPQQ